MSLGTPFKRQAGGVTAALETDRKNSFELAVFFSSYTFHITSNSDNIL
jgi:hypothetical protein